MDEVENTIRCALHYARSHTNHQVGVLLPHYVHAHTELARLCPGSKWALSYNEAIYTTTQSKVTCYSYPLGTQLVGKRLNTMFFEDISPISRRDMLAVQLSLGSW